MKCKIPEISWHNRDPVLSVDIQPKMEYSNLYRLASGGTDSHVLIWSLSFTETAEVNLDVAADLTRHQRAVNVVKWSPNGELLASGDDESVVFIWKQKEESETVNILDNTNEHDKEIWITLKVLRGHMEDIYDLSWAPNSQFLVSGSVDNTAIVWDVQKGKSTSILNDHKGFVQGVAWDPKNQYIATLSTDRFLRIFDMQTKKVVQRVSKAVLQVPKENELHGKKIHLYHDDTLQTFFRRLCFSPDGNLLFTPAGVIDYDGVTQLTHTTYVFTRYSLKQPCIILPSPDQYTVAIKCCPVLFKLRNRTDSALAIPLPYRMVFAIASKSSVYLYDTQQKIPFGIISNIHYTRLTDITWSNDGRILIVSSTDGFCSLITFEDGELGEKYVNTDAQKIPEVKKKNIIKNENRDNVNVLKSNEKNKNNENTGDNLVKLTDKVGNEIVEKDVISSMEKFESPDKKSPATPIAVRRHPRTPTNSNNLLPLKLEQSFEKNTIPNKSQNTSPRLKGNTKYASPIAIRRQPRVLIPTAVEKTTFVEEAMDAWPLKLNAIDKEYDSHIAEGLKSSVALLPNNSIDMTNGSTEDIHLIYEETVEDSQIKERTIEQQETTKKVDGTPERKVPRRVQLKTISTPKSKRQLLE